MPGAVLHRHGRAGDGLVVLVTNLAGDRRDGLRLVRALDVDRLGGVVGLAADRRGDRDGDLPGLAGADRGRLELDGEVLTVLVDLGQLAAGRRGTVHAGDPDVGRGQAAT